MTLVARWVARVAADTLLMRDEYPPFRPDTGPHDPRTAMRTDFDGQAAPES